MTTLGLATAERRREAAAFLLEDVSLNNGGQVPAAQHALMSPEPARIEGWAAAVNALRLSTDGIKRHLARPNDLPGEPKRAALEWVISQDSEPHMRALGRALQSLNLSQQQLSDLATQPSSYRGVPTNMLPKKSLSADALAAWNDAARDLGLPTAP